MKKEKRQKSNKQDTKVHYSPHMCSAQEMQYRQLHYAILKDDILSNGID